MELALQIIAGAFTFGVLLLSLYRDGKQAQNVENKIQLETIKEQDAIRKDAAQVREDISRLPDNVIDLRLFVDPRKDPK